MKSLPLNFEQSGWHLEQVFRQNDVAVYKRWKEGGLPPHFETIRVKSHDGYEIGGKAIAPAEMYPSAKQFGTTGWSFLTGEDAWKKARELLAA